MAGGSVARSADAGDAVGQLLEIGRGDDTDDAVTVDDEHRAVTVDDPVEQITCRIGRSHHTNLVGGRGDQSAVGSTNRKGRQSWSRSSELHSSRPMHRS